MKNKITLLSWLLIGIFLISFGSACNVNHHKTYSDIYQNNLDTNDEVIFIVYDDQYHGSEIYQNENSERYPVSDYAYGYTYRASREYYSDRVYGLERNNYLESRAHQNTHIGPNWLFNGESDYVLYRDNPSYYYEYSDYLRTYEKRECYITPPSNKLVYVKCP